jgi:signal transduction histidine kinase
VVDLTMRVLPETIEISVTDSGPGVPQELRQKIFERFTRLQPSNIIPGAGLGLSIASEIARLHNVKIQFESTLGPPDAPVQTGTKVTLSFQRKVDL